MGKKVLTKEEMDVMRQKRRDYAYAHWLKTKSAGSGSSIGRIGEQKREDNKGGGRYVKGRGRPRKKVARARYQYASTIIPLNGDPILIGPFKTKKSVMAQRMKTVKKLIEEGNARESDIKQYQLYLDGYFDEPEEE